MNFHFDARKATQVACAFIEKEGGEINIMKLVKLTYLLDRLSIQRRGIPVLGGDYLSMKNGPVTSEFLDLINSGKLMEIESDWEQFISDRNDYKVALKYAPETDRLSESERFLINEIHAQHGGQDAFSLVKWCHRNCPEWHPVTQGRREILVEDILEAAGKQPAQIQKIVDLELEARYLDNLLA